MISAWTKQEISSILLQLEQHNLLFSNYTFCRQEDQCSLLGSGSFAMVFDAADRKGRNRYCIKVVGFGEKRVDPEEFRQTMDTQKFMGILCANVVKVYGYTQLYVKLDGDNRVVAAEPVNRDMQQKEDWLLLQFAVMEKLVPVLTMGRNRLPVLTPQGLADGDEKEVLRLGKQIVNALTALHNSKTLHRDVKLENIFYDPQRRRYKLGDFGIVKATQDGLASTVAFTKGYGAPEIVGMPEDRYDCTADIYSLGMVLFVLLNELRFPESSSYRVNPAAQYCKGYVLPAPAFGSDAMTELVRNMCAYNPDDRPQSVTDVGVQMDMLEFSPPMRARAEERSVTMLLGAMLLALGGGILLLRSYYPQSRAFFDSVPWLSPLLLLQGMMFMTQGLAFAKDMFLPASLRQGYSRFMWYAMAIIYVCLIVVAKRPVSNSGITPIFCHMTVSTIVHQIQGDKVGTYGLIIWGFWWLRDRVRRNKRNREEPPASS